VNEHEQDSFETELRRLPPAKLPEEFAERLADARPDVAQWRPAPCARSPQLARRLRWLRWLAPATAAAAGLVALVLWLNAPDRTISNHPARAAAPPALRADDVEIDRQLIGAFEAVATLPDGEPVRIRCREWLDEVILRDTARGVAIEQRTPRFEIIPVCFETF
jgi:hypothetical protein